MKNNIIVPSVQVKMYFEPELISPGESVDMVVKLFPLGNYEQKHYDQLIE